MRASGEEVGPVNKSKTGMNRHPTNLEPSGFGGLSRADLMSRVRSRGNKTTEGRMAALLRSNGITGWRRHAKLPGKPDFVWPKHRIALFVDGCFWHGHQCGRNLTPKNNSELWEKKFAATRRRDTENGRFLRERGWVVVRVWECTLARSPKVCVRRIRAAIERHLLACDNAITIKH
jgi:DNA mismatch endonuclease (patch repair protein)